MIDVACKDGQAGVALFQDHADDLVQVGVTLHPDDFQTGDHDFPDDSILELNDTLDELAFPASNQAPFFTDIDDILDFAFEIFRLGNVPVREALSKALKEAGRRTLGLIHAQPRI